MIDFGWVRPGTTLYIPFHTFDSNDPSASVTITGLIVGDIEVYKNGSATQRASDTGYAMLDGDGMDFDTRAGIHGFSIDLASNADAGFYMSGQQYWVIVDSITVDAATVRFIAATFRIGYENAFLNTNVAVVTSQTEFTLDDGPADDDALNGCVVVFSDLTTAAQVGWGVVNDYTGSTKKMFLDAATTFTLAADDHVAVFPPSNMQAVGMSATAATSLKRSADGVIFGTSSGSPTTTSTPSDLSLNGDDRVIDRTIVFLTGTGAYQAGKITDYVNSTGTVTWSQTFAVAPVSGDTFIII
jgi:hypothetical protein